jgi:hypothetical protein
MELCRKASVSFSATGGTSKATHDDWAPHHIFLTERALRAVVEDRGFIARHCAGWVVGKSESRDGAVITKLTKPGAKAITIVSGVTQTELDAAAACAGAAVPAPRRYRSRDTRLDICAGTCTLGSTRTHARARARALTRRGARALARTLASSRTVGHTRARKHARRHTRAHLCAHMCTQARTHARTLKHTHATHARKHRRAHARIGSRRAACALPVASV